MTPSKQCTGPCGLTKSLDYFYVNRAMRDGRNSRCKECHKAGAEISRKLTRSGATHVQRECVQCSSAFTVERKGTQGRHVTTCSDDCRKAQKAARTSSGYKPKPPKEPRAKRCRWCDELFLEGIQWTL